MPDAIIYILLILLGYSIYKVSMKIAKALDDFSVTIDDLNKQIDQLNKKVILLEEKNK